MNLRFLLHARDWATEIDSSVCSWAFMGQWQPSFLSSRQSVSCRWDKDTHWVEARSSPHPSHDVLAPPPVITGHQTQTMPRVSYGFESWDRTEPWNMRGCPPPSQKFPVDIQCIQQEVELSLGQKSLCLSSSHRQNASIPIRTPTPAFQVSPQSDIFASRMPFSLLFARLTLADLKGLNFEVVLPQEFHDPSNMNAPIQPECFPVVGPILPSSSPKTALLLIVSLLNSNLHESRQYFFHFYLASYHTRPFTDICSIQEWFQSARWIEHWWCEWFRL